MTVKIGISACVLGAPVRFDGGHKNSTFCTQHLQPFVQYISVCPEQAIGMGTPRPPIRLQLNNQQQIRLVQTRDSSLDYTEQMRAFTTKTLPALQGLSGYIVCAKSPSCGMERVKLYDAEGNNLGKVSVGLFTQQLMQAYPWLPVEEDGRLMDPALKENFVSRVFALHDFQQSMAEGFSVARLIAFHSRYKFQLLAHCPVAYRQLGRLVAEAKLFAPAELQHRYQIEFMQAMRKIATRKQHANVLQHLQGFFKQHLTADSKAELVALIDRYRQGYIPLMAPLTLLQYFLKQYPNQYLSQQSYFTPYPEQLGLRA